MTIEPRSARCPRALWLVVPFSIAAASCGSQAQAQAARAQPAEAYLLDRGQEIALARSAGPEAVSDEATILVLTQTGDYETAENGTNGWTCFVGRGWTGPAPVREGRRVLGAENFETNRLGPQCFNALASKSVLAWHRFTTRLFLTGETAETVSDRVQDALKSGELSVPELGAMSYMLSSRQHLNDRIGAWNPHFMFYTPYADGAELFGTEQITTDAPFVTDGGSPWATTTVVAARFSDGSPAPHIR